MPTWEGRDGVVHAVDMRTNRATLACETSMLREPFGTRRPLTHIGTKDDKFSPNETREVTCMACLAEGPTSDGVPEFMTCDACGQLWRELNEKLVPCDRSALDGVTSFRVLKSGTLPTCSRCP